MTTQTVAAPEGEIADILNELHGGRVFAARERAVRALQHWPHSPEITLLAGLAQLRAGTPEEAIRPIESAFAAFEAQTGDRTHSAELLTAAVEAARGLWQVTGRRRHLKLARNLLARERDSGRSGRLLALAAEIAWLDSKQDVARTFATEAVADFKKAGRRRRRGFEETFAQALALLFTGDRLQAKTVLARLDKVRRQHIGAGAEARQRLALLASLGLEAAEEMSAALPEPRVLLFIGPMIEAEGGAGFCPPSLEGPLTEAIAAAVERLDPDVGYCSAAAGADLLFAECLVARGAELQIPLPFDIDDFRAERVAPAGGDWLSRFESVLTAAAAVTSVTEERYLGHPLLYRLNNAFLEGSGCLRAEQLGVEARLLAVWDPAAEADATAPTDLIDQWPDIARLRLVHLDDLRESNGLPEPQPQERPAAPPTVASSAPDRRIAGLLFADIVGFSRMREETLPGLWDWFAKLREEGLIHLPPPILVEAWGDAIYLVTENARTLLAYALSLQAAPQRFPCADFGLDQAVSTRIALHCGPVFTGTHPLTQRPICYGRHVSRAARLEPLAAPGQIFASEHAVAMLTAEEIAVRHACEMTGSDYRDWYRCHFVGMVDLPKKFGQMRSYRIEAIEPMTVPEDLLRPRG